jgi:hypothetical protein
MNKIFAMIGLILFTQAAMANVGFRCPKMKLEITREKHEGEMTLIVRSEEGSIEFNPRLMLPEATTTDAYQERYGHYYAIMEKAHQSFPYMPEGLLIYHISRSGSLYKKGFRAFEGEGSAVELSPLYCKVFVKSILSY